ncbi:MULTISPECIES: hypothetical protein [Methanobacterium]|uniref:Uncharacterized protein n=1 Tax=Methanobacterium bryantii TaxID=2161 RepID=A0A2A2H555_METBR|nr:MULTISPECIES: hypothetical protein [Methanobacterium]OEC84497.1 hypothetical protein A9507_15435 [Methanobacterium sp. A39]PAV04403.1 hypothetical protein ASJ80_06045 [Methanobacterium bryantii]
MDNQDYVLLASIFTIGLLIGLAINGGTSYFTDTLTVTDDLNQTYTNAIDDAMSADDNEISTNLTPITEDNSNLTWQGNSSDKRVLVVLWTTHKSSYPVGGNITTYWGETWVTVVPEIKNFFKSHSISEQYLQLRVAQLLGLPPDSKDDYFVEVWVNPKDLFRPTPDNEINDTTAQLDFPSSVNPAYEKWFDENIIFSYFPKEYPWTRLGYTYDWGNPNSHVGLSEFVIKNNSNIAVKSVQTTKEYLAS